MSTRKGDRKLKIPVHDGEGERNLFVLSYVDTTSAVSPLLENAALMQLAKSIGWSFRDLFQSRYGSSAFLRKSENLFCQSCSEDATASDFDWTRMLLFERLATQRPCFVRSKSVRCVVFSGWRIFIGKKEMDGAFGKLANSHLLPRKGSPCSSKWKKNKRIIWERDHFRDKLVEFQEAIRTTKKLI